MSLVIIHLSDIHIKAETDEILEKSKSIARSVFNHLKDSSVVVILVSGDITFSGTSKQFSLALQFLKKIEYYIKKDRDIKIEFVVCPGNHDCEFNNDPSREFMLKSILSSDFQMLDKQIFHGCTNHQKSFFDFENSLSKSLIGDNLWKTKEVKVSGKSIFFESINLSWCSQKREVQGNVIFPFLQYTSLMEEDCDYRIAFMHHPVNWLNHRSARDFRTNIRPSCNIIFTGHEHEGHAGNLNDTESGETLIIEAGALQGKSLVGSSYSIIDFDVDNGESIYTRYVYSEDDDRYCNDLIKKMDSVNGIGNAISFSESFRGKIEDCGGSFKNSNTSTLKLHDIFVYPDLKRKSGNKGRSDYLSSKKLLNLSSFSNGIILTGGDNVGSTSLLYSLMNEYLSQSKVPVYVKGRSFKKSTPENIDTQIKRALKKQYQQENILDIHSQEFKANKIILIDDFDEARVKSEKFRNTILSYLSEKFGTVILTVDAMFEVSEITMLEGSIASSYEHFEIEQFGYQRRTELIQKWYDLGQAESEVEAEIIAKCNMAERLMDAEMDRSIITPHPIFLLTFLHSIEAGQSSQLVDSALGHYYKFLLTQSLMDAGVSADSLGQEIDYAMHLARYFDERDTLIISENEFREFNDYFSSTWQFSNFDRKEAIFLSAKILIKVGSNYEFRYLYNYYYLIGMYLAKNILDSGVQKKITRYVEHLYVKKYANTILFLAHHSDSDNILYMLKTAADELFKHNKIADFNDGESIICDLMEHAPEAEFNNKSPLDHRKEISRQRDAITNQSDDLEMNEEKDLKDLDVTSKLTMLFKTLEILGQIIKSNPTSFERGKKVEVLKSIFRAPLRALQDFYEFLEKHPDFLNELIEKAVSKKDVNISKSEKEQLSRLIISQVVQALSSSFIIKTAQISNSNSFVLDVPAALSDENALSLELIDIAISIDNHRSLDRRKIGGFYKKCENNMLARKILNLLIINRLHIYKTDEKDMQWLQSELNYDLKSQHYMGYRKDTKRKRITAN